MSSSDDVNPYIPPSSTPDATRRRTRWRIVVVTLLLIFGTVGLVATPIQLLVAFGRPAEFGGGITPLRVLGVFLNAVGSVLWITGGILCWRGRWLSASVGVALGILAFVASARLLDDFDL